MLEPVDDVRITVDDEYVGTVMGDLSSRRGRVTGTASVGAGRTEVTAEVPAIELTSYATVPAQPRARHRACSRAATSGTRRCRSTRRRRCWPRASA